MVEFWILKAGEILEQAVNGLSAPQITSANTVSATDGSMFSYQIVATNSPSLFYATVLPYGLSIDNSTGLISGTAHANSVGEFHLTVQACNEVGVGTLNLLVIFS